MDRDEQIRDAFATVNISIEQPLTAEALKESYHAAMRMWHPDKHTNTGVDTNEEAKKVNAAHTLLKTWFKKGDAAVRPVDVFPFLRVNVNPSTPPPAVRKPNPYPLHEIPFVYASRTYARFLFFKRMFANYWPFPNQIPSNHPQHCCMPIALGVEAVPSSSSISSSSPAFSGHEIRFDLPSVSPHSHSSSSSACDFMSPLSFCQAENYLPIDPKPVVEKILELTLEEIYTWTTDSKNPQCLAAHKVLDIPLHITKSWIHSGMDQYKEDMDEPQPGLFPEYQAGKMDYSWRIPILVPFGACEGMQLHLLNRLPQPKADESTSEATSGHLVVHIKEKPHDRFKRLCPQTPSEKQHLFHVIGAPHLDLLEIALLDGSSLFIYINRDPSSQSAGSSSADVSTAKFTFIYCPKPSIGPVMDRRVVTPLNEDLQLGRCTEDISETIAKALQPIVNDGPILCFCNLGMPALGMKEKVQGQAEQPIVSFYGNLYVQLKGFGVEAAAAASPNPAEL